MRKLLGIFVILSILLFCLSTIVTADSFKLAFTPDKTVLKPGDEIKIDLKISDINVGNTGINALECKLLYDEEIFEKVVQSNIESKNNWSITYNSEETNYKGKMVAMILSAGVKDEQEIGSIKLKVRSDLTSSTLTKQTEVQLVNISTNNGTALVSETDKTIPTTLQFDKVVETPNNDNNQNNQEPKSDTEDKTIAKGEVPQTGTNEIILLFVIGVLGMVATFGYVGYKQIIIK